MPTNFAGADWEPEKVFPIEGIDGQHRLWAFEGFDPGDNFELPVVAFHGLDRGWQAYLFWSVNITPKKINRSLAFDLYPLLRQQSWLDKFFGHPIYRETRCQELVEALWSHPESPWYQRINMLGEKREDRDYKGPAVTQAAWVRSLFASFVKQWEGTSTRLGGLFGAPPQANEPLLPWNRSMQAAVLIYAGNSLKRQVKRAGGWAKHLREVDTADLFRGDDPAFYGEFSLISTDQGIRGVLFVMNDLCFVRSETLSLDEWTSEEVRGPTKGDPSSSATDEEAVSLALKSFADTRGATFINEISEGLATYDWRTSSTLGLTREEQLRQAVFRGSSGYKELRHQLLTHLGSAKPGLKKDCEKIMRVLGYQ